MRRGATENFYSFHFTLIRFSMNRNTTMCFKYCEEKSFFIKVRSVNFDRISDHQGQIDKLFWHDYKG